MSRDYAASCAQKGFPTALDDPIATAVRYHWLEATDSKEDAIKLREKWKRALAEQTTYLTRSEYQALWLPIAAPSAGLDPPALGILGAAVPLSPTPAVSVKR